MKSLISAIVLFLMVNTVFAQKKYFTKTGNVSFSAGTALEAIDGTNKSVASVFDAATGQIEFGMLVKGFDFRSALMMEHFNENYMESDKYPKATFKGRIKNIDKIDFSKDGTYPAVVAGTIEIHGVKKDIEAPGSFKVAGGNVSALASFTVTLEDFKISIPGLVKDKISKTAKVNVDCSYTILNR